MKYKKIQNRYFDIKDIEFRAVEEDGNKILEGYAAKFNSRSKLLFNAFHEIIEPGAFDDVLRSEDLDVVLNFNHDNNLIMARTTNGTLKLSSDETGLFFRATLPNTSTANDVYELVKRGDIFQNSFAFMPAKDGYRVEQEGEFDLVTIMKVERLRDVSTVTFPAYEDTNVSARDENVEIDIREEETSVPVVEDVVVDTEEEREVEPTIIENDLKVKLLKIN